MTEYEYEHERETVGADGTGSHTSWRFFHATGAAPTGEPPALPP
ncbi:MoxR family ATPase, partial [Streptomyces spongiae]|nr:MoxR family ATPase [Streptomyces spongiae]